MGTAVSDTFIHIRVLVGVVLGLGLTRMLAGVGRFIQHPGHKPLYLTHLIWVAVIILSVIHFWWFEMELGRITPLPFELFVFVLFYAFLFYLMATVLMPDEIAIDILQRCDGVATVAAISIALADKYDAARAGVESDVIEMLQNLADKGVLVA